MYISDLPSKSPGSSAEVAFDENSATYKTDMAGLAEGLMAAGGFRMFSSVTYLGLTSGSATIAGAFAAMPSASILICTTSDFATSETPTSGDFTGTIVITKLSTYRAFIQAFSKSDSAGDYRMFCDSSTGVPSGNWQMVTEIQWKDFTISVNLASKAFTYVSASSITVPTGLMLTNIVLWTGSTVGLRNDVALFVTNYGNHNGFIFYNNNNSALSGTVTLRAFYAPTIAI